MLNKAERVALLKFLTFHAGEFRITCREWKCEMHRITNKVEKHKTAENQFRARPLTNQEQAVLSGFLRRLMPEFEPWCKAFEVQSENLMAAIKSMAR